MASAMFSRAAAAKLCLLGGGALLMYIVLLPLLALVTHPHHYPDEAPGPGAAAVAGARPTPSASSLRAREAHVALRLPAGGDHAALLAAHTRQSHEEMRDMLHSVVAGALADHAAHQRQAQLREGAVGRGHMVERPAPQDSTALALAAGDTAAAHAAMAKKAATLALADMQVCVCVCHGSMHEFYCVCAPLTECGESGRGISLTLPPRKGSIHSSM